MSNNQLLQRIEENIQIISEGIGTHAAVGAVLGGAAGVIAASINPEVMKARSDWKKAQKTADNLSKRTKTKEDKLKYQSAKQKASYAEKKFREIRYSRRIQDAIGGGAAGASIASAAHMHNNRSAHRVYAKRR